MKYSICTANGVYFLIIDKYPVAIAGRKIFYETFKELVDAICEGTEYSLHKFKEASVVQKYAAGNNKCLLDLNSFCEFKRIKRTHPEWFL